MKALAFLLLLILSYANVTSACLGDCTVSNIASLLPVDGFILASKIFHISEMAQCDVLVRLSNVCVKGNPLDENVNKACQDAAKIAPLVSRNFQCTHQVLYMSIVNMNERALDLVKALLHQSQPWPWRTIHFSFYLTIIIAFERGNGLILDEQHFELLSLLSPFVWKHKNDVCIKNIGIAIKLKMKTDSEFVQESLNYCWRTYFLAVRHLHKEEWRTDLTYYSDENGSINYAISWTALKAANLQLGRHMRKWSNSSMSTNMDLNLVQRRVQFHPESTAYSVDDEKETKEYGRGIKSIAF